MKPLISGLFLSGLFLASSMLCAIPAQAALIMGPAYISASTSLTSVPGFTINQIADGINDNNVFPYNGFASNSAAGTITLGLLGGLYNLNSFNLWNDINIGQEGVKTFRLDFYNAADTLFSSSGIFTTLNISPVSGEVFSFATVAGVSKVDFVVLSSKIGGFANRIEVREVAFNAIPDPATLWLFGSGLFMLALDGKRRSDSL